MKENLSNDSEIQSIHVSIREKITLLSNLGFVWKEIAALTDIPKRLIKEFANGNIPAVGNINIKEEDCKWLENEIDDLLKRLRNCAEELGSKNCPETDAENETRKGHAIDIQCLTLYTIKEKDDIVIKLEGIKFYD
jgi:hypothetical protein